MASGKLWDDASAVTAKPNLKALLSLYRSLPTLWHARSYVSKTHAHRFLCYGYRHATEGNINDLIYINIHISIFPTLHLSFQSLFLLMGSYRLISIFSGLFLMFFEHSLCLFVHYLIGRFFSSKGLHMTCFAGTVKIRIQKNTLQINNTYPTILYVNICFVYCSLAPEWLLISR